MENKKDNESGMILFNVKSLMGSSINISDFCKYFLGEEENNQNNWTNIKNYDYLIKDKKNKAKVHLIEKNQWIEKVKPYVLPVRYEMVDGMISFLKSNGLIFAVSNPLSKKFDKKNDVKQYNKMDIKALITSYKRVKKNNYDHYEYLDIIWQTVYLTVYGFLPKKEDLLSNDIDEYEYKILKPYGGSMSIPAQRALYYLAKKGNVVAHNDLGELYYYGKITNGEPDYQRAYCEFVKAAGNGDDCYPLGCWNVAYMLFNYRFRRELKNIPAIPELEVEPHEVRIKKAIRYCLRAIKKDVSFMPALNLLGVIFDVIANVDNYRTINVEIINDSFLQEMFREKGEITPELLFKEAANPLYGYAEAENNLWRINCERAFKAEHDSASENKYLMEAIKHLEISAKLHCTWACNKLGVYYSTGEMQIYYEETSTIEKRIFDPKRVVDKRKAFRFFLMAIEDFIDASSAWAAYHILTEFQDDIDDKIIEKCIDIICNLTRNKEVRQNYYAWQRRNVSEMELLREEIDFNKKEIDRIKQIIESKEKELEKIENISVT